MLQQTGTVKAGQVVLDKPLSFRDGMKVRVLIGAAEEGEDPLLFILKNSVNTGIPDLAERHDYYAVHGTPERPKRPKKKK
jgi:hypothetical protein